MWRSLVAHFVRDEGAAGSNPVIPIWREKFTSPRLMTLKCHRSFFIEAKNRALGHLLAVQIFCQPRQGFCCSCLKGIGLNLDSKFLH